MIGGAYTREWTDPTPAEALAHLHRYYGLSHRPTCAADALTTRPCDCGLRVWLARSSIHPVAGLMTIQFEPLNASDPAVRPMMVEQFTLFLDVLEGYTASGYFRTLTPDPRRYMMIVKLVNTDHTGPAIRSLPHQHAFHHWSTLEQDWMCVCGRYYQQETKA